MYLFLGQEEVEGGPLSSLHTDLLAALQNIKQLQPPLTTLEGEKRRICHFKFFLESNELIYRGQYFLAIE
jgi:hypothetical protein